MLIVGLGVEALIFVLSAFDHQQVMTGIGVKFIHNLILMVLQRRLQVGNIMKEAKLDPSVIKVWVMV